MHAIVLEQQKKVKFSNQTNKLKAQQHRGYDQVEIHFRYACTGLYNWVNVHTPRVNTNSQHIVRDEVQHDNTVTLGLLFALQTNLADIFIKAIRHANIYSLNILGLKVYINNALVLDVPFSCSRTPIRETFFFPPKI